MIATDQNPSRPSDWEKETEPLDEDGERGVLPVGVEDGGAGRRGLLWAEREALPLALSRLARDLVGRGRSRSR